jgi:hypothetical protein
VGPAVPIDSPVLKLPRRAEKVNNFRGLKPADGHIVEAVARASGLIDKVTRAFVCSNTKAPASCHKLGFAVRGLT